MAWESPNTSAQVVQRLWRMLPLKIQLSQLFRLPDGSPLIAPYYLSALILHNEGHYTALVRPSGQGVWYWCDDLHVRRESSIWLEFPDHVRITQRRPVLVMYTSGDSVQSLAAFADAIAAATPQNVGPPADPLNSVAAAGGDIPAELHRANEATGSSTPPTEPPPSVSPPPSPSARWLHSAGTPDHNQPVPEAEADIDCRGPSQGKHKRPRPIDMPEPSDHSSEPVAKCHRSAGEHGISNTPTEAAAQQARRRSLDRAEAARRAFLDRMSSIIHTHELERRQRLDRLSLTLQLQRG